MRGFAAKPGSPEFSGREDKGTVLQYRINRCALQALLQRWQRDVPPGEKHDVAQRLSQWLGAMDSVRLDAALRSLDAAPAGTGALSAHDGALLDLRWEQGVQELQALVAQHGAPEPAPRGRAARLAPLPVVADAPVFAAQHKRYLLTQKQLATQVAKLRAGVRQVLAHSAGAMRSLAALDAVMETMLAAREQAVWAALPAFLEPRWQGHMEAAGGLPVVGVRAFEQDVQALLAAELELRLMPLQGLVQAARKEH